MNNSNHLTLRFTHNHLMMDIVRDVPKGHCLIVDKLTLVISEEAYMELMDNSWSKDVLGYGLSNGEEVLEECLERNL